MEKKIEGYIKEKKIIDIYKASKLAVILFVVFAILFGSLFQIIWSPVLELSWKSFIRFTFLFIGGVVIHELIHGFIFGLFARNGFKSIRFGILWEYLTPYCHCSEPLLLKHYIIGALMPALVLGVIPLIISLIIGNVMLLILGVLFISAASGDFMVVWILRKESLNSFVQDHTSEPGCFIYKKQ